jgi:hypothetical protein
MLNFRLRPGLAPAGLLQSAARKVPGYQPKTRQLFVRTMKKLHVFVVGHGETACAAGASQGIQPVAGLFYGRFSNNVGTPGLVGG